MVVLLFKVLGRKWSLRLFLEFIVVALAAGYVKG